MDFRSDSPKIRECENHGFSQGFAMGSLLMLKQQTKTKGLIYLVTVQPECRASVIVVTAKALRRRYEATLLITTVWEQHKSPSRQHSNLKGAAVQTQIQSGSRYDKIAVCSTFKLVVTSGTFELQPSSFKFV